MDDIKKQVDKEENEVYGEDKYNQDVMDIDEAVGNVFGEDAKRKTEKNEEFQGGEEINKDEKTRRGLK